MSQQLGRILMINIQVVNRLLDQMKKIKHLDNTINQD